MGYSVRFEWDRRFLANGLIEIRPLQFAPGEALLRIPVCSQGRLEVTEREPIDVTALQASVEQKQSHYQKHNHTSRFGTHSYNRVTTTGTSQKLLPKWRVLSGLPKFLETSGLRLPVYQEADCGIRL